MDHESEESIISVSCLHASMAEPIACLQRLQATF
jgi:hypothetical protein